MSKLSAIFQAVLGDASQPAQGTTEKHNINTRDGITRKTQRDQHPSMIARRPQKKKHIIETAQTSSGTSETSIVYASAPLGRPTGENRAYGLVRNMLTAMDATSVSRNQPILAGFSQGRCLPTQRKNSTQRNMKSPKQREDSSTKYR